MKNESRTVFNSNNTGHITKKYPMFLGDSLGLHDTVNITNKAISDLKEKQRAFSWYPTEISLTQDKSDMLKVNKSTVDLMTLTIHWQHLIDSVAGRSIGAMLLPHVTNSEAEAMIAEWCRIEFVHGEAYSHIVKQALPNPDQAIINTYKNLQVQSRSQIIIDTFNDLYTMEHSAPIEYKRKVIAKVLCAIMVMECISLMSSFAVTFAIAETGVFQGIGETVRLICRDEQLHTSMCYELVKAMKTHDGWAEVFEEVKPECEQIIKDSVNGEFVWVDYLFSDNRSLVGLTNELLKGNVLYYANIVYDALGIKNPFEVVTENPCTYMKNWTDGYSFQHTPQELSHGGYRLGSVADDVSDDLDLDFTF